MAKWAWICPYSPCFSPSGQLRYIPRVIILLLLIKYILIVGYIIDEQIFYIRGLLRTAVVITGILLFTQNRWFEKHSVYLQTTGINAEEINDMDYVVTEWMSTENMMK